MPATLSLCLFVSLAGEGGAGVEDGDEACAPMGARKSTARWFGARSSSSQTSPETSLRVRLALGMSNAPLGTRSEAAPNGRSAERPLAR